jgi:vacuolar-type H+-ATPase subunit D/Vma8
MPLDKNTLSSLSASLDDVTSRIGEVARAAGSDDEALIELLEVERQLQTAGRRLEKILRRVGRS